MLGFEFEPHQRLAAMLITIQSADVAPEVNLRKSVQAKKHAKEKSTLALKPRADVIRSPNRGISDTPPQNKKKERKKNDTS